jgi:DNA-directed RNA polymerase specialized sigma24 family protein
MAPPLRQTAAARQHRRDLADYLRGGDEEVIAAAEDAGLGGWYIGRPRASSPRTEAAYVEPVVELVDTHRRHLVAHAHAAIKRLPGRYQTLLRKLYVERLPQVRVAWEMGYCERWVRVHGTVALDLLERRLYDDAGRPTPLSKEVDHA